MLRIAWWTFMLSMVGAGLVQFTTACAAQSSVEVRREVRHECFLTYRHIRRVDLRMQRREMIDQCVRDKMGTIGAK